MSDIELPFNYEARPYQLPILKALDRGINRAVWVSHRRSGKDKTMINFIAKKMFERVGTYYYFFPTFSQGRKILWDGMDKEGFKFMNHIPESIRKRTDNTQMLIEVINGSIFQIIGTDNVDSVVGTNPIGCVFSEYSLQDPVAWDYIRPILAENGGWAVFVFTPRGENHGYDIYEMARNDTKNWFTQLLTVLDTKAIPEEVLKQEQEEIIQKNGNDAIYQQEYMCSFNVANTGAYYLHQLKKAEDENRITSVPVEESLPVNTYWDLGIDDSTTIWFMQTVGKEIHFIDYYETSGEGLQHYIQVLQDKKYIYDKHYAPHDIQVRELGTGKSRLETAKSLGINFQVVKKMAIDDGIHACRTLFNRCWFDKVKCSRGLKALKSYCKEYDDKNKCFKSHALHNWSSHSSDAFRTFGVSFKDYVRQELVEKSSVKLKFYS